MPHLDRETQIMVGAVIIMIVIGLWNWVGEQLAALSRDDCPEEGCDGHLKFRCDLEYHGQPVAVWSCTDCEAEVLRGLRGRDETQIIRSAAEPAN